MQCGKGHGTNNCRTLQQRGGGRQPGWGEQERISRGLDDEHAKGRSCSWLGPLPWGREMKELEAENRNGEYIEMHTQPGDVGAESGMGNG